MTRVLPGMSGVFLAVVLMALLAGICGACAGAEESGREGLVVPNSTQASPAEVVEVPVEAPATTTESAAGLGATAAAAGALAASPPEPPAVAEAPPAPDLIVVYITKTGSKYHLASCKHLSQSKIPIGLAEARKMLEPCKACKPPE